MNISEEQQKPPQNERVDTVAHTPLPLRRSQFWQGVRAQNAERANG